MAKVLIVHGAYGNPNKNWFPWLKEELEKKEISVLVPQFPTPEGQSLQSWKKIITRDAEIYVGHSVGCAFILHLLEDRKAQAVFLVAPFISALGNPKFDNVNETFYGEFDWQKIKKNCKKFYLFHSDNDPYVPLAKAEELATKLGVKVILIKGAGHFNSAAGYDQFPELLKMILTIEEKNKKN